MKKFYAVIGNPPYQEQQEGNNEQYSPSIFNYFMDSSYEVGSKVELITPARFLFNAGNTPKAWNKKMLTDEHLKVLSYEPNSKNVFGSAEIPGGVVITYRDSETVCGAIESFTAYDELRLIKDKVFSLQAPRISDAIYIQTRFDLGALYKEHPRAKDSIGSGGRDNRFEKNIFSKVNVFTETAQNQDDVLVLGIHERQRSWRYIPRRFVLQDFDNLDGYKAVLAVANGGAGIICDTPQKICGEPILMKPNEGYTRSFVGIGSFATQIEAENCITYIKSKFARVMLGTLKLTQMINKDVWANVPLQDFTSASDIDWTKSIPEIDQQLYEKYGLDENEINFIETHVKEMS